MALSDSREEPTIASGSDGFRSPRVDRLDAAIALAVLLLTATLVPGIFALVEVRIVAPGLDLVFDTVTTLVTLAVAGLAWQRYRDRGQRTALLGTSAFLVLSVSNAIAAAQALATLDASVSGGSAVLSEGALYVSTAARLIAAGLLVAAEAPRLRSSPSRWPHAVALAPALIVVALVVTGPSLATWLPPLVTAPPGVTAGDSAEIPPVATAANVLLQTVVAGLFAVAAALARRRARLGGAPSQRYIAVALVFAAFAQLHLALYPSAQAGIVTGGDILYLAFDIILLLGVEADTRAYVRELRRANLGLERLRDAEVERAAIEERARLSRELHDGLAQDLWFAKLKVGRLSAVPTLDSEARSLCAELDVAIDSGLTEARQAVMALRTTALEGGTFGELMTRYVDEYGDRFGIGTECVCADDVPRLQTRVEAELLRIAQEALSNVRRHADATVIRVDVRATADRVTMTIRDNGRGFDPTAVEGRGFGLSSMTERAALVGGRLEVESRPQDGTRVVVEVPIGPSDGEPHDPVVADRVVRDER